MKPAAARFRSSPFVRVRLFGPLLRQGKSQQKGQQASACLVMEPGK